MIKISKRLESIASLIDNNNSIIDIGCDHGLLDIYLIENKKNINILATEINKNALNNAKNNIKKYKLENIIKLQESDGLKNIDTTNYNTIIIAGMGSHTIVGILKQSIKKLKNIDNLILQSNNDNYFLRKKVLKLGFYIEKEILIKEKNIYYTIIKFKKGHKYYNKNELHLGPYLIKENSNLFKEKNKEDLKKIKLIYKLIPKRYIFYRLKTISKINIYKKHV